MMAAREMPTCTGGAPPVVCDGTAPPTCCQEAGPDDVIVIDLGLGKTTVVDAVDQVIALSKRWRVCVGGRYAYAYEGTEKVYLHRLICQPPEGMEVDHRDGDRFNNRRVNLRPVTRSQNNQNRRQTNGTSGIRGVRMTRGGKFSARVKVDGREHGLGVFDTAEQAQVVVEEGRRRLMTHAPESTTPTAVDLGDDLSRYLSENCLLCERRSPAGLHLTCVVLTYLTAVLPEVGWVSYDDLRDAVGRSEWEHADLERVRSAIRGLRQRGWQISKGQSGYRLMRQP